jgi:hypothetical protein
MNEDDLAILKAERLRRGSDARKSPGGGAAGGAGKAQGASLDLSEQLDLFAPPRPSEPRLTPSPPPPGFDPYSHPCAACGAPNAPFGVDYPHAPKFFCREHAPQLAANRPLLAA